VAQIGALLKMLYKKCAIAAEEIVICLYLLGNKGVQIGWKNIIKEGKGARFVRKEDEGNERKGD
jgi:hypothetical protein